MNRSFSLRVFVAVCLVSGSFLWPLSSADLIGIVQDESGKPVKGAKVLLSTAMVREGSSPLCPSCYPDCAKSAVSNEAGKFQIAGVDDGLLFNIVVAAPGRKPAYEKRVDSRKGEMRVTLLPRDTSLKTLRGRVLDPEGRPVVGAVVEPAWFENGERKQIGGFPGDDIAVTDMEGVFELSSTSPEMKAVGVQIDGPQIARRLFTPLPVGSEVHEYRMDRGVTVRGRLVRDGKPVAGAVVGIEQNDRNSETYLGEQTIGTDVAGKFELSNVPSGDVWRIYAHRETLPDRGVTGVITVVTGKPDSEVDVPNLEVTEGILVEGRVRLSDGAAIPANTRVLISREGAWDAQTPILDAEGRFDWVARPDDVLRFYVRVKGYTDSSRLPDGFQQEPQLRVSDQTRQFELVMDKEGEPSTAKTLSGVVLSPNGEKAVGAQVDLIGPVQNVVVQDGSIMDYGSLQTLKAKSDEQGRFALVVGDRVLKNYTLIVTHPSGWSEVPLSAETIKLASWARVEGVVRLGDGIMPHAEVKLSYPKARAEGTTVFFQASAKADENGRFVIDRGVEGKGRIGVLGEKDGFRETFLKAKNINTEAGQTTSVMLGGVGVRVAGKIEIPEEILRRKWQGAGRLNLIVDPQGAEHSEDLRIENTHEFTLGADGRFEINDVPPGKYFLQGSLSDSSDPNVMIRESLGDFQGEVTVHHNDKEAKISDISFDVRKPALKLGDKVPPFSIHLPDGATLDLDSLKGKTWVMAFSCDENPQKGNDEPVSALLSSIQESLRPVCIRLRQGMPSSGGGGASPWAEYLMSSETEKLREAFGVQMWPSYYVVDGEGTVVSLERYSHEAVRSIMKALAR